MSAFPYSSTVTTAALISLRETFETSLVITIMLLFLRRGEYGRFLKFVWLGVLGGILTSILLAVILEWYSFTLTDATQELYEGTIMLVASGLLAWMILWMAKHGPLLKASIEREVSTHVREGFAFGIFLMSFLATAREGAELVLFVHASVAASQGGLPTFIGVALGFGVAVMLAVCLYRGIKIVPLHLFFRVTTVLLLILGARLVSGGIHELAEAGTLPELPLLTYGVALLYVLLIGSGMFFAQRKA